MVAGNGLRSDSAVNVVVENRRGRRRSRYLVEGLMAGARGIGTLGLSLLLWGCAGLAPSSGPLLTLTWTAVPGADEYVIERADGGTFRDIARVTGNRTQYIDRAVEMGAEYCYRVRARNRRGLSPPSPQQCGTPKPVAGRSD